MKARLKKMRQRGVTLLETALVTVIVGTAVLALVKLQLSVHTQNSYSQKVTQGLILASDVREMLASQTFTGVQSYNGWSSNPPVDALNQPISGLAQWKQGVTVTLIGDNNGQNLGITGNAAAIVERVAVTVSYQVPNTAIWQTIVTEEWFKTR